MAARVLFQALRGATVVGSVDDTYKEDWLVDANPGTPVQRVDGALSFAITPVSSFMADCFALVNHTIGVNTLLSGVVSTTIPPGSLQLDGTRLNPFKLITPVLVDGTFNLTVVGNGDPALIGDLYGGMSIPLDNYQFDYDPGVSMVRSGEFSSIPPYSKGVAKARRWSGDIQLTDEEFEVIRAWDLATVNGVYPSLFIPDDTINDAVCCDVRYQDHWEDFVHSVSLEIVEIPRTRW